MNAQKIPKVTIIGTTNIASLEVGQAGFFHADLTGDFVGIKEFRWYTDSKPIGKSGESNIVGFMQTDEGTPIYSDPVTLSYASGDDITISWGDNNVCYDKVHVVAVYYDAGGKEHEVYDEKLVNLKCVLPPRIEGINPVNLCCADTIEYCDNSPGSQDDWVWKITGDGADSVIYGDGDTSGQGKKCIKVAVYPSGDFTISAISRRKSWKTQTFTRKDSILVERNQPTTSAITSTSGYGNTFFACRETITTLCVEPVCGMSGVNWNLGDAFEIIGDENAACIQVVPRTHYPANDSPTSGAPIPDGAVINVTAQVIMNGGCATNVSSQNISIFSGISIPPKPDGYVAVNLIEDACDGFGGDFELEYIADTPYVNGFTYMRIGNYKTNEISYQPGLIPVTVCNINPCSLIPNCEVFYVELDEPCTALDDPYPGWWGQAERDDEDIELSKASFKSNKTGLELDVEIKQVLQTQDIVVFPNPASDVLNIRTSELVSAKIILYDMQGRILVNANLEKSNTLQLTIPSQLTNGIYFLSIQSKGKTTVKKITIQR